MLALYHAAGSVCAQKVRLALAERDLACEGRLLDMAKGEQHAPATADYIWEGAPLLPTDRAGRRPSCGCCAPSRSTAPSAR